MNRRIARVALTLLALLVPCALSAQDEIFERGNQLYQEGDFVGAIEAYEAVLSAGFDGAALHYNLGNAYFKAGDLGRSILEWERALVRAPGDPDATANLELARSLTVDAVVPLPRFWLLSAWSGWVRWLPRGVLVLLVGGAWLLTGAGLVTRVWSRSPDTRRLTGWVALASAAVVVVFGINLFVRELGIGQPERGVVLPAAVPVRAAPAEDDDLTLFEIHEGTRVRVEQRTGTWVEVVLDDGKVGWVPADVVEVI
ncbi:MAG: tetratricopeptide repeat protein [Gemmatimonadota bacterium]|nr:tetratricopeptide repeat protein [Gemmatimonadota bacterium]